MKDLNIRLKTVSELSVSKQAVINVFLTHTMFKTKLLDVLKPHDLSIEQFNVLRILRGQKGKPLNLQDVQDRMVSKMSNTTRLIDKLILKEFVNRDECPENRRKIELLISSEGLKKLEEIDTLVDQTETQMTSNLTKTELKQLNFLLTKLATTA
ncbi:MarR family transcriptional regulator [Subsaximicrobium wynnwilliamsii]|uniref:MarR family transcriptional regulator n=1 Tax=Subsaximicrobium wynnwilliamsii TaxID=291179 RepID=A0A5C6ZFN0_9FLAO|nr:MarR family transcriptional regulator [Subsaximicrobium wynnwilliamsii]TXD81784.1 MarR family transcriptional regulator [Subsaximicrobium wynnwilliamsii]TXD87610.1 MarR family transcriptional regulator [Subsaximicrobium wynnwilliamsii]TXE01283.1 MarR family transcriptional regulator [Subsaximicrobium wynnwilliamsii]